MRMTIKRRRESYTSPDGMGGRSTNGSFRVKFRKGFNESFDDFPADLFSDEEIAALEEEQQSEHRHTDGHQWVLDFGGKSAAEWYDELQRREL